MHDQIKNCMVISSVWTWKKDVVEFVSFDCLVLKWVQLQSKEA